MRTLMWVKTLKILMALANCSKGRFVRNYVQIFYYWLL